MAPAAFLLTLALLSPGVAGVPLPEFRVEVQNGGPCGEALEGVLRTAESYASQSDLESAGTLLENALGQCPDHPALLADLAGLRVLKGDLAGAEDLATHLVRIQPESNYAWELLALTRYLQDDAYGALRAWGRAGRPVVQEVDVRVMNRSGSRAPTSASQADQVRGIEEGRALTLEALLRGERRLQSLPAAERARLEYRMIPGGEAAVQGTVVLGARNPLGTRDLPAHALRLLARRIHFASSDPLGRLERLEASGMIEGTLKEAGFTLAHPAPGASGVWRWELIHSTGRYGLAGLADAARETSTGLGWSHTDWITAALRGSAHARIELRPERGAFVGAGTGWSLLPLNSPLALGGEVKGWTQVGGEHPDADGEESESRFGRVKLRASFHAPGPWAGWTRTGRDGSATGLDRSVPGVALLGGVVAVSRGIPPDLMPRIGADGGATMLMRARSDLDDAGVVRPLFPGTAWAHGTIELVQPVWDVGPAGIGVAVFADAIRVLRDSDTLSGERGAVHLGGGIRAWLPWVDGWLRVDWGIDPSDGTSAFSAAWAREARLIGL